MDIQHLSPAEFPPLLNEINDPPRRLFYRGQLPSWDMKFLAIVGARKYTEYGRQVVQTLVEGLRGYPVVIVSGLALGIDSIAHKAALKSGLPTLAIPGSGLDSNVLYPRSHVRLANEIVKREGCLMTEFEPSFRATRWSFPQRNRIMAGLCHAVLVVECTEMSGTLITARLAMEYNRDVLAVPGSIFSNNSAGPHMLIRDGATPVRSSDDILEALDLTQITNHATRNIEIQNLTSDEQIVFNLLKEPLTRDELIRDSGFDTSKANIILGTLELKGLITETLGKVEKSAIKMTVLLTKHSAK